MINTFQIPGIDFSLNSRFAEAKFAEAAGDGAVQEDIDLEATQK